MDELNVKYSGPSVQSLTDNDSKTRSDEDYILGNYRVVNEIEYSYGNKYGDNETLPDIEYNYFLAAGSYNPQGDKYHQFADRQVLKINDFDVVDLSDAALPGYAEQMEYYGTWRGYTILFMAENNGEKWVLNIRAKKLEWSFRWQNGPAEVYAFKHGRLLRLASIGVTVSAANDEITTAPAITKANSRKRRPVIPSINTMGKNTASKVMVVEITAKKISLAPSIPAARGRIPFSIRMYIFSVITMASSTTKPTESTIASMVSTLIEKPSRYMIKNAPMSDTGMTIQGTSVTRQSRKKRKMIMITSTKASMTVSFTSAIEARMKRVLSKLYL